MSDLKSEMTDPGAREGEEISGLLFGAEQRCFGCGPAHPHGFHMHFTREGDHVVTRFTPSFDHQGAPSMMHGGLVTTVADELGAWTLVLLRSRFGFTTSMDCKFKSPIRVGVPLEGRGHIGRDSTRLVDVVIDLHQEGRHCFHGTLRFILLDEKGVEQMIGGPVPEAWRKFIRGSVV